MYTDTHDLCHVFILFTYDFLSGCTYCGKLRAEMQNIFSKQCGIVDCGVVHVALEHLHHITDVAVVLSQLSLEPQGIQQIAFTDARRDLVDLHIQVAHFNLQTWLNNIGGEELEFSLSMQSRHKVEQKYSSAFSKPEHQMEVCCSLLISLSLSLSHTHTHTHTHTHMLVAVCHRKNPQFPLNTRLSGPQIWSRWFAEKRNILLCQESNPKLSSP